MSQNITLQDVLALFSQLQKTPAKKKAGRPRKNSEKDTQIQAAAHKAGRAAQSAHPPKSKDGAEAYKAAVNSHRTLNGLAPKYT